MWSEFIHPLSSSHPTSSLRSGFLKWLHTCKGEGGGNVGWKDICFFPLPHDSLTASSILTPFAVKSPPKVTPADPRPLRKRRPQVANNFAAERQPGPQLRAVVIEGQVRIIATVLEKHLKIRKVPKRFDLEADNRPPVRV